MAKDTVQQTHLPHVGGRPVRWRRWLGGGLLGLIAALFLAWLGFPAWAPLLAQRLVPDNWSVTRLKLERPGFSGLAVRELEARGVEAGLPLRVTGRDIDVRFKGPALDVGQLEVALSGSATPGAGAPFNPAEFSLPRLLLPDGLPAIRIDSLTLRDQRTPAGQQWLFTGLVIGTGGRGFDLQTTIDRPAPLATDLDLGVSLHGDQLQLRAVSHDQPHRLSLDFTPGAGPLGPGTGNCRAGVDAGSCHAGHHRTGADPGARGRMGPEYTAGRNLGTGHICRNRPSATGAGTTRSAESLAGLPRRSTGRRPYRANNPSAGHGRGDRQRTGH